MVMDQKSSRNKISKLLYSYRSVLYWMLQFLVFGVLFWYLKKIGVSTVMEKIESLRLRPLIFGMSLILFINLIRPWRSWVILKSIGVPINRWLLLRWSQEAFFLSLFTPGKIGELYRAYRIEAAYKTMGAGILTTFFDRWIDMVIILLLGLGGVILQPVEQVGNLRNIAIIVLTGLVFTTASIILSSKVRAFIRSCIYLIPYAWIQNRLSLVFSGLGNSFHRLSISSFLQFAMISISIWIIYIIGFYFLFRSAEVNLMILPFISCLALVLLVQSLPVTLFGFGTREAALVMYMGNYGYTSSVALSISFLFVSASFFSMFISGVFWLYRSR